MDIVRSWRNVPGRLKGAALAIGNFDGVHRGHQAVLLEAMRIAEAEGSAARAPWCSSRIRASSSRRTGRSFELTPLPLKLELLAELGLDQTFVIPFDQALSPLSSPKRSPPTFWRAGSAPRMSWSATTSTFGKGRTGTPELSSRRSAEELGFGVDVVRAGRRGRRDLLVEQHARASSQGEAREAAEQLGYWWRVRGKVERGHGRGKGIGFPTLNLPLAQGQDVGARHLRDARLSQGRGAIAAAGYVGARARPSAMARRRSRPICSISTAISMARRSRSSSSSCSAATASFADKEALAEQMAEDCEQAARVVLAKIDGDDPMRRFRSAARSKPRHWIVASRRC